MKICGIELKSNTLVLSLIEYINDEIKYIDVKEKKFVLENDENKDSILDFKNRLDNFILKNSIEKIVIKKRAKKGNFAGGAITFKIESIIQLNSYCNVVFISSQGIAKFQKEKEFDFPTSLNKYQEQAYLSAIANI